MTLDREQRLFQLLQQVLAQPAERREAAARELPGLDEADRARLLKLVRRTADDETQDAQRAAARVAPAFSASTASASPRRAASSTRERPREQPSERPGDRIGAYKLLEILGEGGFGVVWLAERQEPMTQRVALKIIKPGMDTRAVIARFEQERQALAVMDHPNVARILDAGATPSGRPYFVMEHIAGEAITTYCDRHRLSNRVRLELMAQVCDAVQHAHHKGLIHRDLKPNNILVTVREGRALPKVIDFGVAKAVAHALTDKTIFTESGQLIGTPEYMSPEQAEMGATDIDTRTDVYSLGVVLYELISGFLPLDRARLVAAGLAGLCKLIREEEPARPSTRLTTADAATGTTIAKNRQAAREPLQRELRRELDWIPLKALRKDRTQRYATPLALADDIRRYLTGEALDAGPESAAYRLRKFARRYRGPVIAASAVFIVLVAGIASTTLALRKERDANERWRLATDDAEAKAELARQRLAVVQRYFAVNRLAELKAEAAGFSLGDPDLVARCDAWLVSARALVALLAPDSTGTHAGFRGELEALRTRARSPRHADSTDWSFDSDDDSRVHLELSRLVEGIEALDDSETGLIAGRGAIRCNACEGNGSVTSEVNFSFLTASCFSCGGDGARSRAGSFENGVDPAEAGDWSVPAWRTAALLLTEQTLTRPEARQRWTEALASIANRDECPAYDGLVLAPHLGLLPIGRDPTSGLWEFWHSLSGTEPLRDAGGRLLITYETGIVLVLLPAGGFTMGSPDSEPGRDSAEGPQHRVTLDAFLLAKTECTQGQWRTMLGNNPSVLAGLFESVPKVGMTWDDIQGFEQATGLALPSEAQWEYACRAGSTGSHHGNLDAIAWYGGDSVGTAYPVGEKQANAFGLHDMSGNALEWCEDTWRDACTSESADGSAWVDSSVPRRVIRGGSWISSADECRSAWRGSAWPSNRFGWQGFRLCLIPRPVVSGR